MIAKAPHSLHICSTLLNHVSQLVSKKTLPLWSTRIVLGSFRKDVLTGGEGAGTHRIVEGIGLRSGVNPYSSEVGAKAPSMEEGRFSGW